MAAMLSYKKKGGAVPVFLGHFITFLTQATAARVLTLSNGTTNVVHPWTTFGLICQVSSNGLKLAKVLGHVLGQEIMTCQKRASELNRQSDQ